MKGEDVPAALGRATAALHAERTARGHWVGELSSSALATATAVVALAQIGREEDARLLRGGLGWLALTQNADGGWGDTVQSKSNISTTALGWAAFGAARADGEFAEVVQRAQAWLEKGRGASALPAAIAARYGKDRTFSVPILMTLALGGRSGWEHVLPLPFELAALPHQLFGALRLPVVSYALPALIAIGQTIHHHRPTRNPLTHFLRERTRARTLRVLASIQPENGGFLEAVPLTSFVTMSLASMGHAEHPVARKGAEFLRASARADGSWAIDTNLATWVTTLSIEALAAQPAALSPEQRLTLRAWLLGQQYRSEHPYTHAAPGGWAWTDLPGGVPDADDTAGALLALLALGTVDGPTRAAGRAGVRWLLGLQNSDGGIPTFCRGWARCLSIAARRTSPRTPCAPGARGCRSATGRCKSASPAASRGRSPTSRGPSAPTARGSRCGSAMSTHPATKIRSTARRKSSPPCATAGPPGPTPCSAPACAGWRRRRTPTAAGAASAAGRRPWRKPRSPSPRSRARRRSRRRKAARAG